MFWYELRERLQEKGYEVKKFTNGEELVFNTKMCFRSLGENYRVTMTEREIILRSKPRAGIDFFDDGEAYRNVNIIETLIENLLSGVGK